MFQELNDLQRQNGYNRVFINAISRPSLGIGVFAEKNKEWITFASQSIKDFTTPERGLARYVSKDILKISSSEDVTLKVPDTFFRHHFVYNCKTLSSSDVSRRSESTLRKEMTNECTKVPISNTRTSNNSKSRTEIIFQIPKRYQEDSLVDIEHIGMALALHTSTSSDGKESDCFDSTHKSEKKEQANNVVETGSECIIPLASEKVDSFRKYTKNCMIAVTREEDIQFSCLRSDGKQLGGQKENETFPKIDTNKVSIKMGENFVLSWVTNMDEQTENNYCDECNVQIDQKDNDKFPAIQILVKCNGETIQEISSPRQNQDKTYDEEANEKNYNQIFCVNTCNKQAINIETDVCTPTSCENKTETDEILPTECCHTCYMVNTTTRNNSLTDSQVTPECFSRMQKIEASDGSCTKCQLISRICCVPPRIEESKPKNLKQLQKKSEATSKNSNDNNQCTSRNTAIKQCGAASEAQSKSSLCSCPPNKDDIASLGSFSLFFIINDMNTGNCNYKKTDSNELLQTAMICVHVDDSIDKRYKSRNVNGNQMRRPISSSSCPAVVYSFDKTQGNMADKMVSPILCYCPSKTASKSSSCSCPSVRTAPGQSICSCPSFKSATDYVCPFTKDGLDDFKIPPIHSTNTSKRSSMHKTPCCQPSQIRFSVSVQAEKSQGCADSKIKQTSVQVSPSNKLAHIQPSYAGAHRLPQPQGIQASISQKSATIQYSSRTTPTCSQARQVLSHICPPSCKINLPKLDSSPCEKLPCTPAKMPAQRMASVQPTTCNIKSGPSFTSPSCPSLKKIICLGLDSSPSRNPSVVCLNRPATTQSKSCSICINVSRLNDSRDPSLKKVCSFSGECKLTPTSSKGSVKSKTSCSICKEVHEEKMKPHLPTTFNGKPRVVPASPKLGRTKNFNKISHLDVSGADEFIYNDTNKGDLTLITADYSDLKQAFEKFMVTKKAKNPKCKYIKKG